MTRYLINEDPQEDKNASDVPRSQNDCQAKVHEDLGQVVGTGDVLEPVAPGNRVTTPVGLLQVGKYFVSSELVG